MNKPKQLCSKRHLAAIVSTGMLLVSAISVYATGYTVTAYGNYFTCGPGQQSCQGVEQTQQAMYYWCCGVNDICAPPPTVNPYCVLTGVCGYCNYRIP
jgi:hypothetical protein